MTPLRPFRVALPRTVGRTMAAVALGLALAGCASDIQPASPAPASALLADGSVLITGGISNAGVLAAAELWRP